MRAVIQRVSSASVTVDGEVVGKIDRGLMVLVGFCKEDRDNPPIKKFLDKILNMRIFPDDSGRFDTSVLDIKGEVLFVPQFTLFADCSKGRRPEFFSALEPEIATQHFDSLLSEAKNHYKLKIESGIFQADMSVALINEGPVTIIFDLP